MFSRACSRSGVSTLFQSANLEAVTAEPMERKRDEVLALIRS